MTTETRMGRRAARLAARRAWRGRMTAAILVVACGTLPLVGATWAAFSDHDLFATQTVGAGSLIVAADGGLDLGTLQPGQTATGQITVSSGGTVPADLAVTIEGLASLCGAYDPATMAGQLTISIAGLAGADLCALPAGPHTFATAVPVDTETVLTVSVSLAADASDDWRDAAGTSALKFTASQPGGGFTDLDDVTLTVAIGTWEAEPDPDDNPYPPVIGDHLPATDCLPDSEYSWRITIGNMGGVPHLDFTNVDLTTAPNLRQLFGLPQWADDRWTVTKLGGDATRGVIIEAQQIDLTVTGTPYGDCIKVQNGTFTAFGGDGNDRMIAYGSARATFHGGNGNDILYGAGNGTYTFYGDDGNDLLHTGTSAHSVFRGGNGDDVLHSSGNGTTDFDGGDGNDILYVLGQSSNVLHGGPGDDYLYAAPGNSTNHLDGGRPGTNVCDGAGTVVVNCDSGSAVAAAMMGMLLTDEDDDLLDESADDDASSDDPASPDADEPPDDDEPLAEDPQAGDPREGDDAADRRGRRGARRGVDYGRALE